mgnify:CR=1 FL=1
MTGFDLGDAAPDADEEPDSSKDTGRSDRTPEQELEKTEAPKGTEAPKRPESEPKPEPELTDDPVDPTETGPAFPYSEVEQSPLYAREETWTEFEDKLDMELTPVLRQDGIRDDELREIHDIVLEVAIDYLEEFPELLKEKRIEEQ